MQKEQHRTPVGKEIPLGEVRLTRYELQTLSKWCKFTHEGTVAYPFEPNKWIRPYDNKHYTCEFFEETVDKLVELGLLEGEKPDGVRITSRGLGYISGTAAVVTQHLRRIR